MTWYSKSLGESKDIETHSKVIIVGSTDLYFPSQFTKVGRRRKLGTNHPVLAKAMS